VNNRQSDLFWELLANPADKNYSHVQNLRQLVSEYPQSGLLQSLLVYSGEDDNLNHAVAYADPRLLYKLRNDTNSLAAVSDDQLVKTVSARKYFHTDAVGTNEAAVELQQEIDLPFSDADLEQQVLIDEYKPAEHFFEPELAPEQVPVTTGQETIAEPANLDDLINYGDEVTTGEHDLMPPVTEFRQPEQQETEEAQPGPVQQTAETEESIPLHEHTLTAGQEEHPVAEITLPEEPPIEQQIPVEETRPEPEIQQEIELPALGFYVPGMADQDSDSYTGGDMGSKLYESYAETFEPAPKPAPEPIEDEVFEEITSIDAINMSESFVVPKDGVPQSPQPVEEVDEPALGFQIPHATEAPKEESTTAKSHKVNLNDEAEKLMLGNIAATDFFVFDQALSEHIKSVDEAKETPQSASAEQAAQNTEPTAKQSRTKRVEYMRITKYFDEKMPYSFMWWLDKTRREHSGIYQPFIEFKLDTSQEIEKNVDELQQQYYENIFQLTSVEELERATGTDPMIFDVRKKEDEIIERFIHDSPQIKPQTGEKLDNENKARRSSEDQDEIVSETLAQVYSDQMLYHKAIRVYQKLMLKFPEKSSYFATQIEQLEKKIL